MKLNGGRAIVAIVCFVFVEQAHGLLSSAAHVVSMTRDEFISEGMYPSMENSMEGPRIPN